MKLIIRLQTAVTDGLGSIKDQLVEQQAAMTKADAQLKSTQDVDETDLTTVLGQADSAMAASVEQHIVTLGEQAAGMGVHRDTLQAALAEQNAAQEAMYESVMANVSQVLKQGMQVTSS